MVARWLGELPNKFPGTRIDSNIVMPNHMHAVIIKTGRPGAVGADLCVRPSEANVHPDKISNTPGPSNTGKGADISTVVQWFKTMTTNAYIKGVRQKDWPYFPGRLWQRNFHDHIIRGREDLARVRAYIVENPAKWETDPEFPDAVFVNG